MAFQSVLIPWACDVLMSHDFHIFHTAVFCHIMNLNLRSYYNSVLFIYDVYVKYYWNSWESFFESQAWLVHSPLLKGAVSGREEFMPLKNSNLLLGTSTLLNSSFSLSRVPVFLEFRSRDSVRFYLERHWQRLALERFHFLRCLRTKS